MRELTIRPAGEEPKGDEVNLTVPPGVKHLFVSVLVGGGMVFEHHAACREALRTACYEAGIVLTISRNAGTGVDRARNIEVMKMRSMDPPVTDFMFIDNDIVFDPKWVVNMVHTELDIIAAAYPRKEIDWERVEKAVKDGVAAKDLQDKSATFIVNGYKGRGVLTNVGTFAEVEEVGTGFMLIKRRVIEKYIESYKDEITYINDHPHYYGKPCHMVFKCDVDPRSKLEEAKRLVLKCAENAVRNGCFDDPKDLTMRACAELYVQRLEEGDAARGRYLTEDYRFCVMAGLLGFKTYLYLDCKLEHIGMHTFTGDIMSNLKVEDAKANSHPNTGS